MCFLLIVNIWKEIEVLFFLWKRKSIVKNISIIKEIVLGGYKVFKRINIVDIFF